MLLSVAPFTELTMFIQGIVWIVLPLLLFSLLVTVLIHYGKKRKRLDETEEKEIEMDIGSSPENFCYKTGDGKFIFLDHTGLLREFKRKLSYSNARYAALKQDFGKLKASTTTFPVDRYPLFNNLKNINMENSMGQMMHQSGDPISIMVNESSDQEVVLNPVVTDQNVLSEENSAVENATMKSNVNEQSWLQDLLEEKNKQIEFLQNQIDIRVKRNHITDQERSFFKNELEELRKNQQTKVGEVELLKEQVQQKDVDLEHFKKLVDEKNQLLTENQQLLNAKQDQLIYIENVLNEIKEQNQILSAAVADTKDNNENLSLQLQQEESRVAAMEKKLLSNKQLLQRMYNEFANCLEEEKETSHLAAV